MTSASLRPAHAAYGCRCAARSGSAVRREASVAGLALLMLASGGCGIFGGGESEAEPPAELVSLKATTKLRRQWSTKVGDDAESLRLGLSPATDAVRVYAASRDGQVHALDPENGRKIWSTRLKLALSAGPGTGDNRVVVASAEGDVIALDAASGTELWRRPIAAEVLATPAVGGQRVVVRTADGRLLALNGETGVEEWVIEESVPRLSLRGTSAPVVAANLVVCGFDNGRLLAADLLDGTVVWEQTLSPPSGRTDLERLVDIDGAIAAVGREIYVSGFRGRVVALTLDSGQALWERELSSYDGPGVDWVHTYIATDSGEVVALSRSTGVEQWRNDQLRRRQLTRPTPFDGSVVVGDFEGYLHWLDAATGELTARVRVAKGRISGSPTAQGDTMYAQSESGVVAAYRVQGRDET